MLRQLADGQPVTALGRLAQAAQRAAGREVRGEAAAFGILLEDLEQGVGGDLRRREALVLLRLGGDALLLLLGFLREVVQRRALGRLLEAGEDLSDVARLGGAQLRLQLLVQRLVQCAAHPVEPCQRAVVAPSEPAQVPAAQRLGGARQAVGAEPVTGGALHRQVVRAGLLGLRQLRRQLRLRRVLEQLVDAGVVLAQLGELPDRGGLALLRRQRRRQRRALGGRHDLLQLPAPLLDLLAELGEVGRPALAGGDGAHLLQDLPQLLRAVGLLLPALALEAREDGVHPRQLAAHLAGGRVRERAVGGGGEVRHRLLEAAGHRVPAVGALQERAQLVLLRLAALDRARLDDDGTERVVEARHLVFDGRLGLRAGRPHRQLVGRRLGRGAAEDLRRGVLEHVLDGRLQLLAEEAELSGDGRRRLRGGLLRRVEGIARLHRPEPPAAGDEPQRQLPAQRRAGRRGEDLHRGHHVEPHRAAELDAGASLQLRRLAEVIGAEIDACRLPSAADAVHAGRVAGHLLDALERDLRRPCLRCHGLVERGLLSLAQRLLRQKRGVGLGPRDLPWRRLRFLLGQLLLQLLGQRDLLHNQWSDRLDLRFLRVGRGGGGPLLLDRQADEHRPLLRQRGQIRYRRRAGLVLLRRRLLVRFLLLGDLAVALRLDVLLPQALVPLEGAVALAGELEDLAVLLRSEPLALLRLRKERGGLIDAALAGLEEVDQRVAVLARELRELQPQRLPVADAAFQVVLEVELLRPHLYVREPFLDALDVGLGRAGGEQAGACSPDRAEERVGGVMPLLQFAGEAVGLLLFLQALLELGGLDRRLHHRAMKLLDLVPAGCARQILSPSGRWPK